jgi:hypothetical protein
MRSEVTNEYQPHKKVPLREIGRDEKWLQSQIANDPSIIGLGDLNLFRKELKQASGGRLDMLLSDPESDTMYEVEIMLGATDPSRIIRTIEYWDVESRRYANREHRAVIIAEEITNRFFNVIWLLSRSIPLIAIQLDALAFGDNLLLHFTKVLDLYEAPETGEEQPVGMADRQSWDERSSPEAMALFDRFMKLLSDRSIDAKLNFRQDGIALAGKWNFARIIPRKSGHCLLRFSARLPQDVLREGREKLELAGIPVKAMPGERFSVQLDSKALDKGADILANLVKLGVNLKD